MPAQPLDVEVGRRQEDASAKLHEKSPLLDPDSRKPLTSCFENPIHGLAPTSQLHAPALCPNDEKGALEPTQDECNQAGMGEVCDHVHYSHRSPWLRAFVLGANDGLVSVAALMLGMGGGSDELKTMRLAGVAAWVGGALSMAVGEYISVASQKDTELADIEKERQQQLKGPAARAAELEELTQIYVARGLDYDLAKRVALQLTDKDVIKAHARDELGIDVDELANPMQAAVVSALAFTAGAAIPLLAGVFILNHVARMVTIGAVSSLGLAVFGLLGAHLGGARLVVGALRVLIGGVLAMCITFGVGKLIGGGMV